jgi:hypothetical protein
MDSEFSCTKRGRNDAVSNEPATRLKSVPKVQKPAKSRRPIPWDGSSSIPTTVKSRSTLEKNKDVLIIGCIVRVLNLVIEALAVSSSILLTIAALSLNIIRYLDTSGSKPPKKTGALGIGMLARRRDPLEPRNKASPLSTSPNTAVSKSERPASLPTYCTFSANKLCITQYHTPKSSK